MKAEDVFTHYVNSGRPSVTRRGMVGNRKVVDKGIQPHIYLVGAVEIIMHLKID